MQPDPIPVDEFLPHPLAPGKHRLRVIVAEQVTWTPLLVVGQAPGPTLLVIAGIHGDEYEGIRAIHQAFGRLDPSEMAGIFVGLPVVNVPAYRNQSRCSPEDGQDLARVFPGKPDGTTTERLADALHRFLFPQADLICDLHSAGTHYEVRPLAGYALLDDDVGDVQRRAAIAFGLPLVWGTPPLEGRSLSSARDCRRPAIYVEMPGMGRCRPEHVQLDVDGILNLMGLLSILPARVFPTDPIGDLCEDRIPGAGHMQIQCLAEHDGLFIPSVDLWDRVKAGDEIGPLYDDAGEVLQTVRTAQAGRLLVLRRTPSVKKGDFTATIIRVPG